MSDQIGTAKTLRTLPVLIGSGGSDNVRREGGKARGDAAFAAQMLGSTGARRGLKGGPPVLEAARSAYLQSQWSGSADRRPTTGSLTLVRV